MKQYHLHMISDSTGETLSSIARSVMSQFDDVELTEHMWALIRTEGQMQRVIDNIRENPGMVIFTIVDSKLKHMVENICKELKLPFVPVLSKVTREMSRYLGVKPSKITGRQYELDEEYFERVDAMSYTLMHDDGQMPDDIDTADIVIVGVSRTSKTPTSVYLSYRGLKVANVPFVSGCPLPDKLFTMKDKFVVGLVISPDRLSQIRKSRLLSLNENRDTDYVDMDNIKAEIAEARKMFNSQGWKTLDVTRKSVEEVSAQIMQLYNKFLGEE